MVKTLLQAGCMSEKASKHQCKRLIVPQANNQQTKQEVEKAAQAEILNDDSVESSKAQTTIVRQEVFSGPIPRAKELAEYKQVQKDLPDRIVKMAEDDLSHIHFIQKVEAVVDGIGTILGIVSALLLGGFTVYSGAQVAIAGSELAGSFISTIGIGGIIGTFIYGTRKNPSNK